jgi:purine-binding chemotaxis protein CheW
MTEIRLPSGQSIQMGMVVDNVEEVLNLAATDIEPSPDFGSQVTNEFILGIAKVKGNVKLILDIEKVVVGETLTQLARI